MTFDIQAAKRHLHQRDVQRREYLNRLEKQAKQDADRIIKMLIERFSPLRIYQWGSLLKTASFREWSDIDIAIEGLANPLTGLEAADAAKQMTEFSVDIIEIEHTYPMHAKTIRAEGKLVYEKK